MSQPLNPPTSPIPGAIYTEELTGISWVWTGVAWIEGGPSSNYSAQIRTGMALTPGYYSGLSTTSPGTGGSNLASIGTQYGPTAPTNPSFGQMWVDTTDATRPVSYVWTDPGSWTKMSDGVTNTYVQATAPTDQETGDTWFNSSSSELNIWDGVQWRQIVGTGGGGTATGVQSYASTPAVQAEGSIVYNTTEDKLYISNGSAWVEIDYAPDEDTNSILAIAAPTLRANGDPLQSGDNWVDTSSNSIYYYSGTQWVRLASATVGDTHSFWSATSPTARPDLTALQAGDFWVDSDDAKAYVWTGSIWSPLTTDQDNNTNSIVSAAAPSLRPTSNDTTLQVGDLWVNTADFSISYFTGLTWIPLTAQTSASGDKHSFTGATTPTIVQRPDGNPLLVGDQWINTVTSVLSYWSGSSWVAVTASAVDTHSFTGTGAPILTARPDTAALQDGDMYVDDATNTIYYYDLSAAAWKSTGAVAQDTHSFTGTGAPTLTVRPDTTALQDGDMYVDDATDTGYYYDVSATSWKVLGASGVKAQPFVWGTVLGYTGDGSHGPYGSTYLGYGAGNTTSTATNNTILGAFSASGITGLFNTIVGSQSQAQYYAGNHNSTVGYSTKLGNNSSYNVVLGSNSLNHQTGLTYNITVGYKVGENMISNVSHNIMMGFTAGDSLVGGNNLLLGNKSGFRSTTNKTTIIGSYSPVETIPDGTLILARHDQTADSTLLRINENSAYGVPTASTGVGVNYGTAGEVLTSQGTGAPPTWSAGGGTPAATPTTLGTVYGRASDPYAVSLGLFAGGNLIGGGYGTVLLGSGAGQNVTTGQDIIFIGSGAGGNATSNLTEVTIIGGHDGTGLVTGDFVLAPSTSFGSNHTKKYLQIDVGGAIGLPTTPLGSIVNYGTSGQVLTSQGPAAHPTWSTVAGGAPDFHDTFVASSVSQGSTFPTLRSDGASALVTGDIFRSTVTLRSYYYNGTTWVPNGTHNFVMTTTPPAVETWDGDTWSNPSGSNFYTRYNDGVSSSWVSM